jgi:hypothetical protein
MCISSIIKIIETLIIFRVLCFVEVYLNIDRYIKYIKRINEKKLLVSLKYKRVKDLASSSIIDFHFHSPSRFKKE